MTSSLSYFLFREDGPQNSDKDWVCFLLLTNETNKDRKDRENYELISPTFPASFPIFYFLIFF